ncbi:putative secreted protein (Por secretion system target) [Dyadobacter jiangsuensis]|uniref:Putative secreted protein (Por secretion system target) n=2 Tax=Dyadobacter jiangsuensis TaxID=1591085 RepID=A0A2P8FLV7_9BACT|nr:putative secreted protein (Por secretion system target) [Dyadobacter jiangsuensis]
MSTVQSTHTSYPTMNIKIRVLIILLAFSLFARKGNAQDLDINLNPQQALILDKTNGALEVKICNCHTANVASGNDKLRPQISFPENLTIQDITNTDGSALTGFSIQSLNNAPGNHTVRLLMNTSLANASCASFLIQVKGNGVGAGIITATLGFQGPQTVGNFTANDNALATIPVQVNFPVELKEFRAKKEGGSTILEWTTSEEINASHFDVQRSGNGRNWQTFATVKAKGDSKSQINYTTRDSTPLNGENFYRLHMIDIDESSTYSAIRKVRFEFEPVLVFPNPATNILNVKINDWSKVRYIIIRGINGQEFYRSTDKRTSQINLMPFAPGSYIVEVTMHNGEVNTFRIAVSK